MLSDEDNDVVTLGDAVKEKLQKDEEIVAVVGACDENECSYKNVSIIMHVFFLIFDKPCIASEITSYTIMPYHA